MGSSSSNPTTAHVTSVRLTADEHAALKRIAAVDRRSLSDEMRFLIDRRATELDALEQAA